MACLNKALRGRRSLYSYLVTILKSSLGRLTVTFSVLTVIIFHLHSGITIPTKSITPILTFINSISPLFNLLYGISKFVTSNNIVAVRFIAPINTWHKCHRYNTICSCLIYQAVQNMHDESCNYFVNALATFLMAFATNRICSTNPFLFLVKSRKL